MKIKAKYNWEEDFPKDPKKLIKSFERCVCMYSACGCCKCERDCCYHRWLSVGTKGNPLTVVIDGLNQLENNDGAHVLGNHLYILATPNVSSLFLIYSF